MNRWVSDKIIAYRSDYRLGRYIDLIADILAEISQISPLTVIWQPIYWSERLFLANSLVDVYITSIFAIFVD
jgi:hypothetical protein